MINNVVMVGRLTKDVELRYTPNGVATASFTLAVNRTFKNKQTGETEADFIQCVVWQKPAENLANYQKKGNQIGVTGRIQTRRYEQDGKTVYVTEVVAENIQFLEPKKSSEGSNSGGSYQNNQRQGNSNQSNRSGNQGSYNNNQQQSNNNSYQKSDDPFQNSGGNINISDDDLPF